ncbi:hypothetical protein L1887_62067 [Cichorium endivia]|nr:hypothetical protein L1887_62067 [Cichorium endivia]
MTLGAPPNGIGNRGGGGGISGRHATMPSALQRNSDAERARGRRRNVFAGPHLGRLYQPTPTRPGGAAWASPPPHVAQAAASIPLHHEEPPRTWSYDQLSGLKTYPILQLPDRETHDVYDAAWGLDAGGLAKHLGQVPADVQRGARPAHNERRTSTDQGSVQMGFQPHRKKLFYFDA